MTEPSTIAIAHVATPTATMLIPSSFKEIMELAEWLAKASSLRPELVAKPFDVFSILLAGSELGLPVAASLRGVFTVNGRTALEGKTKMALCLQRGVAVYFERTEHTKDKTTWETMRRGAKKPQTQTYTRAEADAAGLTNKAGPWKGYTQRMISHRAIGWLCDDVYPDVLMGVGNAEDDERPNAPVFQSLGMVGPGVELGAAPAKAKAAESIQAPNPPAAAEVQTPATAPIAATEAPPTVAEPAPASTPPPAPAKPSKPALDDAGFADLKAALRAAKTDDEIKAVSAKVVTFDMSKEWRDELSAIRAEQKIMIRDAAKAEREASGQATLPMGGGK